MDVDGRVLDPAVRTALTHRPGLVDGEPEAPVDLAVLVGFFDGLLRELPWWDGGWRVIGVETARPREFPSAEGRGKNRFTEVSVPGTVGDRDGRVLAFFGRVRFEGDRLVGFQAKVGDMVIGPALAEAGAHEPHQFGAVLRKLMDNRGLSMKDVAVRTGRALSTIAGVRSGGRNPHPVLVQDLAGALELPAADLAAIAGVDPA